MSRSDVETPRFGGMETRKMQTHNQQNLLYALRAGYDDLERRIAQEPVAMHLLAEPRTDLNVYGALLEGSYPYVCRTAPWLALAAQRVEDPELAGLLARKAAEERGHEQWILADLEAMGRDVETPEQWRVTRPVAAYIGWHDFVIPVLRAEAIMGAAYVLERLSKNAGLLAQRLQAQGVSPAITSFMRGHADADVSHVRELEDVLARLDGNGDAAAQIRLSAEVTASAYIGLLRSIAV